MPRPMPDVAHQLRWLVDDRDPDAKVMRVVVAHLNPPRPAALDDTCAPAEARRLVKNLAWH